MAEGNRRLGTLLAILLVAAAVVGATAVIRRQKPQNAPPEPPSQPVEAARAESAAPAAPAKAAAGGDFDRLSGKWARADGDYLLDIRRVASDGRLDAAYLNPNPIRVSQAKAKQEQGLVHVFVELRDQGYPGCTYTLVFDRANDCLAGNYYQAAMGETYPVVFTRVRP